MSEGRKVRPTGPITCNRCGIILVGVFWTAMDGKAARPALGLHCSNCRRVVEVVTTSGPAIWMPPARSETT